MAQFTIPDWARAAAARVDLARSPYWGTQELGDGGYSMGNGNGLGYYRPLSQFAGAAIDPVGGTYSRPDIAGAEDWLTGSGQQMMEAAEGQQGMRWLQDAQGNITAEPEAFDFNDKAFWNAALLAGAVTGANIYGAGSAVGGAGSGAAAEGGAALAAESAGAGAAGYAPATNAALAESAVGTAGYGASSAGAGGGAGQLSGGLLSGWDGLKQAGGSLLDYAAKNPKAVGGLIGAVAGGAEGGGSGGGDGGAAYSGPMPAINRGGWQPQAQAQQMAVPTFGANMNKSPGAANSGLWRFLGGK